MRNTVTFLSLIATFVTTAGCAGSSDSAAPKCTVVSASSEAAAATTRVAAWKSRLPSIFKYGFERSTDGAIRSIPTCVKTAAQTPEFATFVEQKGLIVTNSSIELAFDYFYTPGAPRVMKVKLEKSGLRWIGEQVEDSLTGLIGWRGSDLDLPNCRAEDLARPEDIKFIAKDGRSTRVAGLTDAPGALSCH